MRVVVADDHALLRAGLIELLRKDGFDIVGEARDAVELVAAARQTTPDVVVADIRMPPGNTLDGLVAARTIRREHGTTVGIVLLSQYVETRYLQELLLDGATGLGYLLKDRILDPAEMSEAIRRVAAGGSAIDPVIIDELLRARRGEEALARLTERERQVLGGMAEGRSNQSIATVLQISEKTVEACTGRIFTKLDLVASEDDHRRVRAVLAYLQRTP